MADTFLQMARQLRLHCALAPMELCEFWVRDRWRRVCEDRRWSFLRTQSQFTVPAVYSTGTIALTNASTTVTGTDTVWTSAMTGRQLKVGSVAPVFTFTYVSPTSGTLDMAWGKADATAQTYQILGAYQTAPTDFLTFLSCVDPANQWRLHVNYFDVTHLDALDPARSSSGNPYVLASHNDASTGAARFEMWPHPTAQRPYPFIYIKRTADLSSSFTLPDIITGDILVRGALADLARWPGPSVQAKNPAFNIGLAATYEAEFADRVRIAQRQDNERNQIDLDYDSMPLAPLSANFAQSHAMREVGFEYF